MMSWQTVLAIGSGGFIGAVSRAYLNGLISHRVPHELPFGTLGVNLIGSLIMGILVAFFMNSDIFSLHVKSFLSTGILGALTTYSTFAIETALLIQGGSIFLALSNMALNVFGTVIFATIGFVTTEHFLR